MLRLKAFGLNKMNIAYITTYDAEQPHSWSGTGHAIMASLRARGHHVDNIVVRGSAWPYQGVAKLWHRRLGLRNYRIERRHAHLQSLASDAEKSLSLKTYDCVVSPGSIPISYLNTDIPIVIWSDATFLNMVDYYKSFSNLPVSNVVEAKDAEWAAFNRCSQVVFSSEWARDSLVDNYDVDRDKSTVIPFAANFPCLLAREDLLNHLNKKSYRACRLLFVGSDWKRKGGDFLLKIADEMVDMGVDVTVDVVGCDAITTAPDYVRFHGFIATRMPAGRAILERLFLQAHFLVVPSEAECFGIVYAEASSYGLPTIAKNVGGVSSAVVSGENGILIDQNVAASDCANIIFKWYSDPVKYRELSLRSLDFYDQNLNWNVVSSQFEKVLEAV